MIGIAVGAVLEGIEGVLVRVEADVVPGFPQFSIVGLPDSAVTESKLRIRSAIRNAGIGFPQGRITVNLSPASMRKHGAGLDLAITIAILRAAGYLPHETNRIAFCAELSLSGLLIPVREALGVTITFMQEGINYIVVSESQPGHHMIPNGSNWLFGSDLSHVCKALRLESSFTNSKSGSVLGETIRDEIDMAEIDGLESAKRALTIAATGNHHTLLIGPPGSGKTMLAERFQTIFPDLNPEEALEVYTIAQAYQNKGWNYPRPPVRIPHHSLTPAGLIGGGNPPHPGEVSFSHNGILILDELLEFPRKTLESLREPLSGHAVYVSRSGKAIKFPAKFVLIATTNPCPCGLRGFGECVCTNIDVKRYFHKLSGPLLDRMDIVMKIEPHIVNKKTTTKTHSERLRKKVIEAKQILRMKTNTTKNWVNWADLDKDARELIDRIGTGLQLSRRGIDAIYRLSRTISALAGSDKISRIHVEEAVFLRNTFLSK